MERAVLDLVHERGPVSARRIAKILNVKRRLVNGILHGADKTCKTERSPLSHVNARVVWTISEQTVRPDPRKKINSRNKAIRRAARAAEKNLVDSNE